MLGLTNHVVWADNVYFIWHFLENVLAMAHDVTDVLVSLKMRWKESSLQLLGTTSLADATPLLCKNGRALPVSVIEVMEVLGILLTSSGNTVRSIRLRLSKASSAFWANQST